MYTVISEAHWIKKTPPNMLLGAIWSHGTPESAVAHAEARLRFDGETYIVLYDGKIIYQTQL